MTITLAELNSMSDEEVRNLNRTLGKKVMKKFIAFTVVKVGLTVAIIVVANKLGNHVVENTPKED